MVLLFTEMIPGVKPKKYKGTCSFCHLVFRLHTKNGLVHQHGLRAIPCLGSHQLPWSTRTQNCTCSVANESQLNSKTDMIDQTQTHDASATQNPSPVRSIQHLYLSRGLLRHVPKGARSGAGHLLTKVMKSILSNPAGLAGWERLLAVGTEIFDVALRGGRRRNLTSLVKKLVADFHDGWTTIGDAPSHPDTDYPPGRRLPDSNSRRALAAAVTAKLEDGNISAAAPLPWPHHK